MSSFDAGRTLGERFRAHARALESSHAPSPLYTELMSRMADDWDAGGVVREICRGWEDAPGGSVVQLRLLGALHRNVLRGDEPELAAFYRTAGGTKDPSTVWPVAHTVLRARAAELAEALAVAPQTNEPGRSTALLAGVLHAVRHSDLSNVRLLEVGASGGLNLLVDRFRFEGPDWSYGPADSPLVLHDPVQGPVQQPFPPWSVVERRGCDLEPVDVGSPDGRLHLRSFVWPDHVQRFQRLNAALEVAERAGADVAVVDRAPAGAWLEQQLSARSDPSVLTVVWQSITRMYWPVAEVERVRAAVRRAARDLPLAHVSMEYEDDGGAVLHVDLWSGNGPERHDRLGTVADHGVPVRLAPGVSLGG